MRLSTRIGSLAACMLPLCCASAAGYPVKLIPGSFTEGRQPDGNTVIFEDRMGLIVIDTGRHRDHQDKILRYARERKKPIRAIVNTHWHLDHSGGNRALRQVYPQAKLYTSNAVSGALQGFLARSLANARAKLADPKVSDSEKAEIRLGVEAVTDRRDLLPDVPVTGDMKLPYGSKPLELHLASHAATEGDTWIYDPASRTAVVGDLVVIPLPFFDTACADGWRRALGQVAKIPFKTLIPGHGPALSREEFDTYRTAFDRLMDCARSSASTETCIGGWQKDAASLIRTDRDRKAVQPYLKYYIDEVIRIPGKQAEFCGVSM